MGAERHIGRRNSRNQKTRVNAEIRSWKVRENSTMVK